MCFIGTLTIVGASKKYEEGDMVISRMVGGRMLEVTLTPEEKYQIYEEVLFEMQKGNVIDALETDYDVFGKDFEDMYGLAYSVLVEHIDDITVDVYQYLDGLDADCNRDDAWDYALTQASHNLMERLNGKWGS